MPFLVVPGVPRNLTATVNGPESITISWQEPEITNGLITSYRLTISIDSGPLNTNDIEDTTFIADMLSPFTNYSFEVAAVTSAGTGMSATTIAITAEDGKLSEINVYISY
ncbi:MAG: hypothetical protein A6F71_10065 [Cycloclasticus sp. symbiont of Poecilosclerida sp. M]|nr:MAG: hypothetical protein A6F71_10065 [Cycloclasticus sp. symbiont of Poecilosclerida sp. M]